ncbi:MAG: biopolymer transporter ExbD [Kofleriaceae bacterium]
MGAAVGADEKGSVNVELNIVPFIDLMSCLVMFLLASAVWVNIARIDIQPKGKSLAQSAVTEVEDKVILSVLIQKERVWICKSRDGSCSEIPKPSPTAEHDWDKFEVTLAEYKASGDFVDRRDLEIAAESTKSSPVNYKDVISAMDVALRVGFGDVGLSDPAGLAARPQQ